MHLERYRDLLEGFCILTGIEPPESLADDGELCLDEVDFALVYGGEAAPADVLIYCDFGPVDALNTASCIELLGRNMLLYDGQHTVAFGVSPDAERILLMTAADLLDVTPAGLLKQLEYCARLSTQWRDGAWKNIETHQKADSHE